MVLSSQKKILLLVLGLAIASCGGDDASSREPSGSDDADEADGADDSNDDDAPAKDASASRDGGTRKDAGNAIDAGSDEPTGDEPTGDDTAEDASTSPRDAGRSDSGAPSRSDAGQAADAGRSDAGGGAGNTCDTLTYATFGKTFFDTYCISCHGGVLAQKNVHLDTLAGAQANKAKVQREVSSGAMPPRGSKAPTSAEKQQLAQWIMCGAK